MLVDDDIGMVDGTSGQDGRQDKCEVESESEGSDIPDEHENGFNHNEYKRRYALRVVTIS